MANVNYTDFDKITDVIMFFDNIHTLEFTTRLSTKDKNGYRRFYEFETQYLSSQYIGVDIGRNIKRNMNFYYAINNRDEFTSSILLRTGDVYILQTILKAKALPWFFGSTRLFQVKNNRLIIKGEYQPVEYIKDLQSWLRFEPIILEYEDGTFKEGVRMFICSNEDFVDMNIDKFLEFFSYLNHNIMYLQSEAQCNYAKMGPYLANNIVLGGGLGSGGGINSERMADNKYGLEDPNKTQKQVNSFLSNAKSKKNE